jgi:hypothetical protein
MCEQAAMKTSRRSIFDGVQKRVTVSLCLLEWITHFVSASKPRPVT